MTNQSEARQREIEKIAKAWDNEGHIDDVHPNTLKKATMLVDEYNIGSAERFEIVFLDKINPDTLKGYMRAIEAKSYKD